jgi:tetraacyldisaccharide 4'-kinase
MAFSRRSYRRILRPLSVLYGSAAALDRRRKLATRYRSKLPVISVGNISVGGSGKTPLVIWLIEQLQQHREVLVLSRGYARQTNSELEWRPGEPHPNPKFFGDEPALISRRLTNGAIAVGANRAALLRSIEANHPGACVLLDDGFQHHRLARDLDIVIVDDGTVEHPRLLPAGDLREPLSALRRADILLATSNPAMELAHSWRREDVPVYRLRFVPRGLRGWSGSPTPAIDEPMILVTGIARPQRMRQATLDAGIVPIAHFPFKDHHRYTPAEAHHLRVELDRAGARWILTTGKDAVKLERFAELAGTLVVLEQKVEIEREEEFRARIEQTLNHHRQQQ